MSSVPMKNARLASLSASFIFSTVAACLGLHALIKSNQSQSHLKSLVTPPTVLTIDVSQIFNVGVVATTVCTLIGVLTSNFIAITLIPGFRAFSNKTLRLQAGVLAFSTLWLLASQIPFMIFFATRSAKVRAFVGSVELPEALIKNIEKSTGQTSVYKDIWYLRLTAIFPWFALVSTAGAVFVLFKAAGAVRHAAATSTTPAAVHSKHESDKESVSQIEKASV